MRPHEGQLTLFPAIVLIGGGPRLSIATETLTVKNGASVLGRPLPLPAVRSLLPTLTAW